MRLPSLALPLAALLLAGCASPGSLLESEPRAVIAHAADPRALVECVHARLVTDGVGMGAQLAHDEARRESLLTMPVYGLTGPQSTAWVLRVREGSAALHGVSTIAGYQGQHVPELVGECSAA